MSASVSLDESLVRKIVESNGISTLFQPVVSIDKKSVIGFEAFSRGVVENGEVVKSSELFESDWPQDLLLSLDKACAGFAARRFKKFIEKMPGLLLFVNVDVRALQQAGPGHFLQAIAESASLPHKNVVVEIPASQAGEAHVREFVNARRKEGFQICVDKVSRSVGILEVLLECRPDYIKLDRSIWCNPADATYSRENLQVISKTFERVGCEPIAVGVETEKEALALLQSNMFNHQGYFYTSGGSTQKDSGGIGGFNEAVTRINNKFKTMHQERIGERKARFELRRMQVKRISSKFNEVAEDEFSAALKSIVQVFDDVVSAFILDEKGIQVTPRVARGDIPKSPRSERAVNTVGSDHSLRDYFMYPAMGYETFVTSPFLSPFTGESSIFISFRFFSGLKDFHLLCIEFSEA